MNRGIIYVVFGQGYDKLAAHTVSYSRQFTNLPICILTNTHERNKKWDKIKDVSFVEFNLPQDDNRHIKTNMINYTPFDETLCLDCDSVIQRFGIEKTFDLLDGYDMVLNLCLAWKSGEQVLRLYKKVMNITGVELPLRVFNGAFIIWKRNERVQDFFALWNEYWEKSGRGREMPCLACAVKKSGVKVKEINTDEDKIFVADNPREGCIVQHNYNSYQGKDFHNTFGLPHIIENKPFDGNASDWQMVDF